MRRSPLFFTIILILIALMPASVLAEVANPVGAWNRHFETWLIVAVAVWLVVTIPMFYFLIRYRRRDKGEYGAYIKGNTGLEILWTAVPTIIIALLGVQTWKVWNMYRVVPQDAYEVRVNGFRYGFEFIYPEGIRTINELRVPEGPVRLSLSSRDVIHDFALPGFRIREDMLPARYTYLWFYADKPGVLRHAYCAELCGPGHSLMHAKIVVMKKEDFKAWISSKKGGEGASSSPDLRGKELIKQCTGCHSLTGERIAGPTFKGLFGKVEPIADGTQVTVDKAYIKESIRSPKARIVDGYPPIMPPFNLSDEDIDAIVAYLKEIK